MPSTPAIVAFDIGGANLKAAHSAGQVLSRPFELWRQPNGLEAALGGMLGELPAFDHMAVTMTGELCDCFETKRQGVATILDAVAAVAKNVPVRVWQTSGAFADLAEARKQPLLAAAANWLALATFAGRFVPERAGLLIDIGSTTTDIIPLWQGRPAPRGRADPERLRTRELLYCGMRRTPVCTLLGADGAAEFFATMHDVYVLLDDVAENANDCSTADGRAATKTFAQARLARMLCADSETSDAAEILELARRLRARQVDWIAEAIRAVATSLPEPPAAVVLAGTGECLARLALPRLGAVAIISLQERFGSHVSAAACAYALAVLAAEQGGA